MNWFTSSIGKEAKPSSKNSKNGRNTNDKIVILDKIGSGSYGTVHYCQFDEENSTNFYVAKRAWTFNELVDKQSEAQDKSNYGEEDKDAKIAKKKKDKDEQKKLKERAKRCQHYLTVEEHCLEKIKKANAKLDEDGSDSDSDSAGNKKQLLPNCIGRFVDNTDGNEWLVFDLIVKKQTQNNDDSNPDTSTSMTTPPQAAKSLHNAMFLDWKDQHKPGDVRHHHLYMIQKALGMDKSDNDDGEECTTTFEDTLDVILKSLLEVLVATHEQNIVHRDVKPDNLLIDGNTQVRMMIFLLIFEQIFSISFH
jgi:serine/threonine protein kinase